MDDGNEARCARGVDVAHGATHLRGRRQGRRDATLQGVS